MSVVYSTNKFNSTRQPALTPISENNAGLDLIPVIVLSILQFEKDPQLKNDNSSDPVLFYVHLGERIQDVRGISRDETRIRIIAPNKQDDNLQNNKQLVFEKSIMLQVKQGSNNTLGYLRIPLHILANLQNNAVKTWFPLFIEKEHEQLTLEMLQDVVSSYAGSKVYIDLKIIDELPQQQPTYGSPQKNPFKSQNLQNDQTATQSPINNNFYRDDISNGTYEEISDNITLIQGRPQQDPMKYVAQSTGQQIIRVKKKTYTQSAMPQIQLGSSQTNIKPQQQQQQQVLSPEEINKQLIKEEWLKELPSNMDKQQVKNDLTLQSDESIISINGTLSQKSQDLTNWYLRTKQISQQDHNNLLTNDQRSTQLQTLQKDTISLINYRKEQEMLKQQLETQSKLVELHGQHQSKKEKLERLQEVVQRLKQDMLNLQTQASMEQSSKFANGSPLTEQILLLKQELLMHLSQIKQTTSTQTLQDAVYQESDTIKTTLLNTQLDLTSTLEKEALNTLSLDQDQHKLNIYYTTLKNSNTLSQQSLEQQNLHINFLQKQIIAEQQFIKQSDNAYREIVKREKGKLEAEKENVLGVQFERVERVLREKESIEKELKESQQKLNDLLIERENDGTLLNSSPEVQKQTQELQETLKLLKQALSERQQVINDLKSLRSHLNISVNSDSLQKILQMNMGTSENEIVKEKNELLNTKNLKYNEVLLSIDNVNASLDIANSKIDIHREFKESLDKLEDKERQLAIEQQKLRKVNEDFKRWKEESNEKLQIQQKDFRDFDEEMQKQDEELKKLKLIEQSKLNSLLGVRTKEELESYMRERLSIIREMEASLRGKDHEIDTLELIQSQKDSIILELEEQAGKFKEVIKEVHYESQKNDRVEAALYQYLQIYPSQIDMRKLGDGYYKYGSRRIYIKFDSDTLLVRVAPKEYITLAMFIIENEAFELQKQGMGKAIATRFK